MSSALWRCFLSVEALRAATASRPEVGYISFVTTSSSPGSWPPRVSRNNFIVASLADDSPFERLNLPWPLHFFGRETYVFFVSPNGAIHLSAQQPCRICNCYGDASSCNITSNYFGLVAGFLTDLNPGGRSDIASISYYSELGNGNNTKSITIIYDSVPFYGEDLNSTFRISLFKDSRIDIIYDRVHPQRVVYSWLSGLVAPEQDFYANFTSSQLSVGTEDWNTTLPGIRPEVDQVKSGSTFHACPFSMVWCATPSSFVVKLSTKSVYKFSSSQNSKILLKPLSLSCTDIVQYAIHLPASTSSAYSESEVAVCNSTGTTAAPVLECDLSDVVGQLTVTGSVYAQVVWRAKGTSNDFSAIHINSIPLQFSTTSSKSIGGYAVNTVVGACSSGDICARNLTCLNTTCDNSTSPVLYKYPPYSCSVGVEATNISQCSWDLVYDSGSGTCCSVDDQDCQGTCYGKAQLAVTSSGGENYCCPANKKVDCAGVCGGSQSRDACGVCGGGDTTGESCATQVTVTAEDGSTSIWAHVDASDADNLYAVTYINVSNHNNTAVYVFVELSSKNHKNYGPEIHFPRSSIHVGGHESVLIPINVSVATLYSGVHGTWESKRLVVKYTRLSTDTLGYAHELMVYVKTHNCSNVLVRGACMRLPACIYCIRYNSIRVLRAVDELSPINVSLLHVKNHTLLRQLYTSIVPDGMSTTFSSYMMDGICTDGLTPAVCETLVSSRGSRSFPTMTVSSSWAVMMALVIFLAIGNDALK
jgi:hypothetical protein